MLTIERILCPVDFSEFSDLAFDYAQSVALHYKATLFLQHVIDSLTPPYPFNPFPDSYEEVCRNVRAGAERQLHEFAESHTRPGVQLQYDVRDGVVTDLILGFAEAQAVNLIVMGTHGLRGIDHVALGSVTEKVLRKARCPVLAVRKPAHAIAAPEEEPELIPLHRILYCTDFSDNSEKAWEYAVSLAAEYNAELTALHVLEETSNATEIESVIVKVLERLEGRIPPEAIKNGKAKAAVRIGQAYQQIIELAVEAEMDLIITGVRGRDALDLAVFGSTTYRVIQLGPCPVLVVHI
jgi:nucleotide-binding universal stress UspA family protein